MIITAAGEIGPAIGLGLGLGRLGGALTTAPYYSGFTDVGTPLIAGTPRTYNLVLVRYRFPGGNLFNEEWGIPSDYRPSGNCDLLHTRKVAGAFENYSELRLKAVGRPALHRVNYRASPFMRILPPPRYAVRSACDSLFAVALP
jgi:hypothetical protein